MYSFKEKKRHFSDLKNTSAAESDLLLLKSKVKQVISAWERQPKRYADDILYRLLDVATREEIRINRRERMKVHDAPSQNRMTMMYRNVFRKLKLPERKPKNVPRKQKQPWKKPRNVLRKQRRLLKKRKKKSRIQRAPHEKSEKAKARRVPANRLG